MMAYYKTLIKFIIKNIKLSINEPLFVSFGIII